MLYKYKRFTQKDGIREYEIPELNNKRLPSSTTITGQIEKKALYYWHGAMAVDYLREHVIDELLAERLTVEELREMDIAQILKNAKNYANKKKTEAGDLGSRVHHWIHAYFGAEEGEEISFDPDMEMPLSAFMEWYLSSEVKPLVLNIDGREEPAIERRVWSGQANGYAGTLDLVAYVLDKKTGLYDLTVIDFKTSKAIYSDMAMQVSSYFHAFEERHEIRPARSAILRLDKERGFPQYCPLTDEENNRSFRKFKELCEYYHEDDHKRRK